jgi:hypothetical protein
VVGLSYVAASAAIVHREAPCVLTALLIKASSPDLQLWRVEKVLQRPFLCILPA